ncbi:hypothetical protein HYX02_06240 [Candidatus Woesearchaeota archaeon]|nr:hypothetical protein [Candidatus Woesearchaeota archaeon]
MKKRLAFWLFILFILFAYPIIAHEGEPEEEFMLDHSQLYPLSQLAVVGYGSIAFGILILVVLLFHKKMNDLHKRAVYLLIVIVVAIVTLYLVITTLHLNLTSLTKGPVHWHADFEVWVCGKELHLPEAKGLSNKQGVDLMHAHEDKRIHVEGVILDERQASVGAFFYAIGGSITDDGLKMPADDGLVSMHDGDKCNEQPAKLYVFVNGNLIQNPGDYVIAPYEKVPPGDRIKIIFTEKPVQEINPYLK